MSRPCVCDKCEVGKLFERGQCHLCWLYHNNQKYRDHWDGTTTTDTRDPPRPECSHLGKPLEWLPCCQAKWRRECAVFGETTLQKCQGCTEYAES